MGHNYQNLREVDFYFILNLISQYKYNMITKDHLSVCLFLKIVSYYLNVILYWDIQFLWCVNVLLFLNIYFERKKILHRCISVCLWLFYPKLVFLPFCFFLWFGELKFAMKLYNEKLQIRSELCYNWSTDQECNFKDSSFSIGFVL